jgi:hypothetical protein
LTGQLFIYFQYIVPQNTSGGQNEIKGLKNKQYQNFSPMGVLDPMSAQRMLHPPAPQFNFFNGKIKNPPPKGRGGLPQFLSILKQILF